MKVYHIDWGVEQQFLYTHGVKFGDLIATKKYTKLEGDLSFCHEEYEIQGVRSLDTGTHSWLCCGLSVKKTDTFIDISSRLWWDDHTPVSENNFEYRGEIKKGLQQLAHFINDVDVFAFDRDVLTILAEAATTLQVDLRLSRFKRATKIWKSPSDDLFLLMPGRERLGVEVVVRSMNVSPPLDQFTLEAAVSHPNICRNPVSNIPDRPSTSDRLVWITNLEKDNNNILSARSMSRASNTIFTKVVEGGQQRKVWNTLLEYFYNQHLLINYTDLSNTVLVKNRNSFPAPPHLPNMPVCRRVKRKPRRSKDLFGKLLPTKTETADAKKKLQREKNAKKYRGGYVTEPKSTFLVFFTGRPKER